MLNESSKKIFPRLHFLSNDEFNHVKDNAKDCSSLSAAMTKVQLLSNLFDGVEELVYENGKVTKVKGKKNTLILANPVAPTENCLATTLKNVRDEARNSIKNQLAKAVPILNDENGYSNLLASDLTDNVVFVANQIAQTKNTEDHIAKNELGKLLCCLKQGLEKLIKNSCSSKEDLRKSLIIDSIYRIRTISHLIQHKIENCDSWIWKAYIRAYFDEADQQVVIKQGDISVNFGNDYIDDVTRLVITPLTIKAYHNHMAAISHRMLFSAHGPAGTGKTETIKDLAKNLGFNTFVVNCSDQMGTDFFLFNDEILTDIANDQLFICFDEFNRISFEGLNTALPNLAKAVSVSNKNGLQVGITMNPGYAGRTELPKEHEALSLKIPMTVPEFATIGEVMLATEGFLNWQNNAEYITRLLSECQLYLSKQRIYDFGMRSLKSISRLAGHYLTAGSDDNVSEAQAIKSALVSTLTPRMTESDKNCFSKMVENYFPNVQVSCVADSKLEEAKATLSVRHGILVYGEENKGKSFIKQVADSAGYKLYEVCHTNNVEFYGVFNPDTKNWTDGNFTKVMRQVAETDEKAIIAIYGLDCQEGDHAFACAVEELNCVLDDNKRLLLANGDVIPLKSNARICVCSCKGDRMSPAFVSRTGVVRI